MSLAGAGAAEVLVNPKPAVEGLTAGLSAAGLALIISAADAFTRSQTNTPMTKVLCASSTSSWCIIIKVRGCSRV